MEQKNDIKQELYAISPRLAETLEKENPIVNVPSGYFDTLSQTMLMAAKSADLQTPAKVISMYLNALTRTAVAACVTLLLGLAITHPGMGSSPVSLDQLQVKAELPRISDAALSHFLNNEQVLAIQADQAKWQDVLSRIDDQELSQYVNAVTLF